MLRPRGSANDRGYTWRWRAARADYLALHPLCRYCEQLGRLTPASVVDHIIPHRGNAELFWDVANWQPLCKRCHDSIKAKEERGGATGCDAAGLPLAATHHWSTG